MSSLGSLSIETKTRFSTMNTTEKAFFLEDNVIQSKPLSDFEGVYMGDEFCERRLPSILALENICNHYSRLNLDLTLTTPYLTNEGIKKFAQILDYIVKEKLNLREIVINDWGALKLLRDYNDRFRIILGRVLVSRYLKILHSKAKLKGYRIDEEKIEFYYLFPDSFLDFIKEKNITALEFNSSYHLATTYKQLLKYRFKIHIYYPFVYLTTTRYCSCINGFNSYFRSAIENCNKECKEYSAVMTNSNFAQSIYIKGNAYFIKQNEDINCLDLKLDRIIYNDFIKIEPMH